MAALARPHLSNDRSKRHPGRVAAGLLGALGLLLAAGSASALEDLSPGALKAAPGDACPALTQIKYPWLTCQANEFGGVSLSAPGEAAPLVCHLRLRDGRCAASPNDWHFIVPVLNPPPDV